MFDDIIGKPASRDVMGGRKEKYLSNPDFCPYCGDDRFEVDDFGHLIDIGTQAQVAVKCLACNKSWIDTIELGDAGDVDIINVRFDQ